MVRLNNKGFTLFELLGCLIILGVILCIGLYSARGTLATASSTLDKINDNDICNAAEVYVMEYQKSWINNGEEYTCISVSELIDYGYFNSNDVISYKDKEIKIVRDSITKVVSKSELVDECE